MSFAFLPLYTGDYLRDTRHLTPMKHGVYLLLLMHCWDQKGPLPLDEQECAGIANCRSGDEIVALRYVLEKYFIRMDDGWYNLRMTKEVKRSESISSARSKAGKLGYQAKAKQLLSNSQASATTPTPTTIPTLKPKDLTTKSSKLDDARAVLQFLNKVTERQYEPVDSNLKPLAARILETSVEEVKRVVARKAEEWLGTEMDKYLRPATLFNATKFHQYLAEARQSHGV